MWGRTSPEKPRRHVFDATTNQGRYLAENEPSPPEAAHTPQGAVIRARIRALQQVGTAPGVIAEKLRLNRTTVYRHGAVIAAALKELQKQQLSEKPTKSKRRNRNSTAVQPQCNRNSYRFGGRYA